MKKQKLKAELLSGMCECAEYIHVQGGIKFINNYRPMPFKPGVSDKMLFNGIIDKVIDNITSEVPHIFNSSIIAVNIMAKYYYPQYEVFDRGGRQ